jgi:eukaryotic-like serine/threonine-protein kinase
VDPPNDQELRSEAQHRIGRTLRGKWHLDALIDVGGMAAVYCATHRNGLRGAVKMLHASFSHDSRTRQRFLLEGYIANTVEHPGAVHVLDDDITMDGQAFLVMELLEGKALHEMAAESGGKLDVDRVLLVADQLLDVLAAAHAKGIVHRDIKPDNVFLTREGRVKVLDFGIARMSESKSRGAHATEAGAPMGTPAFMAPEQARGRWDLVGPQSDIWAVGATMFTLLSGRTVHGEGTVAELLAAAFTKPAPSLAEVAPEIPREVVELVDRALALRMADRWDDAEAMREAVRAAYRSASSTGGTIPPPPPPSERAAMFRSGRRAAVIVTDDAPKADASVETMSSVATEVKPRARHRHLGRRALVGALLGGAFVVVLVGAMPRRVTALEASPQKIAAAPRLAQADDLVRAEIPLDPIETPPAIPSGERIVRPAPVTSVPSAARAVAPRPRAVDLKALYDRRH